MNQSDLNRTKSADLRNSRAAMRRAAGEARKTAIQTNTGIIVVHDGKPVHVSAAQLREGKE